ncbi:MAG: (Fe-S)-binding protein [Candidatus Thorarchaeota archaeon]
MTLGELERMMDSCVRCSKCKFLPGIMVRSKEFSTICPSIDRYNFHAYSGGGKVIMANALHKGRIEFTKEMLDVLYKCTNCGACEVVCKFFFELEPNEIIHELRVAAVEAGVGPMPNHKKFIEQVDLVHNPYGEPTDKRSSWLTEDIELDESSDTIFFAGCTASYRREEIAKATVRILNAAEEGFKMLGPDEYCCGSPVYRVGDKKRALEIMKDNVERFKAQGIKRIITSCAGCYNMLKVEYPRFVETDFEVIHTSQLMESLISEGRLKLTNEVPLKVTYHDPCHLGRMAEPYEPWEGELVEVIALVYMHDPPKPIRRGANGVYDAPRNVLKQIPGIELVEMERVREYAYCCGAGAGVKSQYPDFALSTSGKRIEEAESTGATALVSTCPFCSTNFKDMLKEHDDPMEFYDLTELVLQSIGGSE